MFDINSVPSQPGRVAIVTGANIGLGFETAKALAKKEMTVVMACRSEQKASEAMAAIRQEIPKAQLHFLALDLSDLASVRRSAEKFLTEFSRLDLLINNAGVMMPPYQKTVDGFELQMGANYFGHFLLSSLLLPLLEQTEGARIVNLSSIVHRSGKIHFDDMHFEKRYSKQAAYAQSKLAMLMFSYELDRRLKDKGYKTLSIAAHPGVSMTGLVRHFPDWLVSLSKPLMKRFMSQPEEGAQPQLYAALGNDIAGGDYTGPDGFREIRGKAIKVEPESHARDLDVARRLWEVSIQLTGAKFFNAPETSETKDSAPV
jgi:NAD(P)-dependent dehydrogenase (short-subunit alcohol dehydrogenase family)